MDTFIIRESSHSKGSLIVNIKSLSDTKDEVKYWCWLRNLCDLSLPLHLICNQTLSDVYSKVDVYRGGSKVFLAKTKSDLVFVSLKILIDTAN